MTMIQRDHLEHKYYTHTSPNDAIISTYVPFLPFPILTTWEVGEAGTTAEAARQTTCCTGGVSTLFTTDPAAGKLAEDVFQVFPPNKGEMGQFSGKFFTS